jgi:formate C-acetyltransferase
MDAWRNFTGGEWQECIDLRDFIMKNFKPYDGDASFLSSLTPRTERLWEKCRELLSRELDKGGVLDIDVDTVSGILSFGPGYIDSNDEVIVGLQTDAPLKRMVNPFGGIRLAKKSCEAYGYTLNKEIEDTFTHYRKTHNDGVFSAYTDEMKKLRHSGVITGLLCLRPLPHHR